MSKYFKQIHIPVMLFIIGFALFILVILFYGKVTEGYTVISYADAQGNNIGLLDVTDISGNWIVNSNQQLNSVNYAGKTCRDVCDSLSACNGFLLTTDTETTGTCTFKTDVTQQQPNQNFNYYLNIK